MLLNLSYVKLDGRRVFAKCTFLEKLNLDFACDRSLYFFSVLPGILSLFISFRFLVPVLGLKHYEKAESV
jgi:hypothetical protein